MKITSITPAGVADVYNMEVEETHDFAVNSGVIVHNCYDECRYVLMERPIAPRKNIVEIVPQFDPLDLSDDPSRPSSRYSFYKL